MNGYQLVDAKIPIRRHHRRVKLKFQFDTLAILRETHSSRPFFILSYDFPSSNAKSWLTTGACHDELNQIPLTKCRIYAREELRTEEIGPSFTGMGG